VTKETRFLSRLLGLYCLLIAVAMLAQRQATVVTVGELLHDRPLMYVLGVLCVFAGLAMILVHNIWSGGPAAVIVTLIGWLTLLKGIVFVGLEPMQTAALYMAELRFERMYPLYALVTLVLGAYLCYAGFGGVTKRKVA
jgi:hypothetical protein